MSIDNVNNEFNITLYLYKECIIITKQFGWSRMTPEENYPYIEY